MSRAQRSIRGRRAAPLWTAMEWLLGIIGGIAAFLGIFLLVAGDDQSVGIGGDLSWRVGDVASAWAYGLLLGGGALLLVALGMVIGARRSGATGLDSQTGLPGVVWHAGIFAVVNAFIWIQDIALGEGMYAFWVTIPWAIGLAIHALTYYLTLGEESGTEPVEGPKSEEAVDQESMQRL